MSKLSFRARALDASKPMPIYMAEELPDLPDYSAINRAVPQMPSGMEKEEECEHHLQRAICAGLIIPTPEVSDIPDQDFYNHIYPPNYRQPRQLIHMQPLSMEQDSPDYDMDSEDERWLHSPTQRLELSPTKFEEMMDRLEKSSGQTVVTLHEAKALLKEDDDLIIAVFDYWLNKRLKTQHPLILTVKTEQRAGTAANNPYLAFRRRTEKMQTRKNRKNDETSYEKMLKLRRDLARAVSLLDMVKKREIAKRDNVSITAEIYEKRFHARDFSGSIYAEASAIKTSRPAFTPIFHNHYTNQGWSNKTILKDEVIPRKERRQYKKRKHKQFGQSRSSGGGVDSGGLDGLGGVMSSEDEATMPHLSPEPDDMEDEGPFAFRRNKLCSYHMPLPNEGNWPWYSREDNGLADKRYRFTLTSLSNNRCIGFARRRVGRGGRILLDRYATMNDDYWRTLDFSIGEPTEIKLRVSNFYAVKTSPGHVNRQSEDSTGALVRTDIKKDFSGDFSNEGNISARTNIKSEFDCDGGSCAKSDNGDLTVQIKKEIDDDQDPAAAVHKETTPVSENDQQEMIEMLRSVHKDWPHFRPKTPPPGSETPCSMLPATDSYWVPEVDEPGSFLVEIQPLDSSNVLLDTSLFTADSIFENLDSNSDVPITDTRQSSAAPSTSTATPINDNKRKQTVQTGINLNVNVGLNTLTTPSVVNNKSNHSSGVLTNTQNSSITSEKYDRESPSSSDDERTIGCSRFYVTDSGERSSSISTQTPTTSTAAAAFTIPPKVHQNVSSTLISSKCNSLNAVSDGRPKISTADGASLVNTNGLLSQFGFDGRTRNNKIPYAYNPGGVGYSNASPGTLSLHTSAHPLTLNSHSANILEIPITDDTEPVANKLVNSQCTEAGASSSNNKTKTIVRKNNLVMEVT